MFKKNLSKTFIMHVISLITQSEKVLFGAFDQNDLLTYMQECDVEPARQDKI